MVLAGTSDLDKAIWMFKDLADACNALAIALEIIKTEASKKLLQKPNEKSGIVPNYQMPQESCDRGWKKIRMGLFRTSC
jgi:hypothetical protein